jgi:2-haloacid dehalogenase
MYKELHFDTWGTLVDNYSIADVIEQQVYESHLAQKIAQDWRKHQKWAMFYTTLADNFVIHPASTTPACKYALDKHNVQLSKAAMEDICNNYHKLRAYPEVVNALKGMKALGLTLRIVANPTKKMIEDHSRYAGNASLHRRDHLERRGSAGVQAVAESVPAWHPEGKVQEGGDPLGDRALLGIVGANRQGLATAWVNRAREPKLEIGVEPTYTIPHMQALTDILADKMRKAG